jgi:hypothetical protein
VFRKWVEGGPCDSWNICDLKSVFINELIMQAISDYLVD